MITKTFLGGCNYLSWFQYGIPLNKVVDGVCSKTNRPPKICGIFLNVSTSVIDQWWVTHTHTQNNGYFKVFLYYFMPESARMMKKGKNFAWCCIHEYQYPSMRHSIQVCDTKWSSLLEKNIMNYLLPLNINDHGLFGHELDALLLLLIDSLRAVGINKKR